MVKAFTNMDFNKTQVPPLYTELARSLGGEIDASYLSLEKHSRDYSSCKISPHIITYPKTIDDIKKIIACADEFKIPISVKGYGKIIGVKAWLTKPFKPDQLKDTIAKLILP